MNIFRPGTPILSYCEQRAPTPELFDNFLDENQCYFWLGLMRTAGNDIIEIETGVTLIIRSGYNILWQDRPSHEKNFPSR